MSMNADQIAEYQVFAEQLAEAAALAIQPYFRAKLDVEDKGGGCSIQLLWPTRPPSGPCAS